jgi:hypothetical protein
MFAGIKVKADVNRANMSISVPVRWYTKNNNGILFGGILCMASDPFPALFLQHLVPGVTAYNKDICVEYLRPIRETVHTTIQFELDELNEIRTTIARLGKFEKNYRFEFQTASRKTVAVVESTAYLRKLKPKSDS